jgi:metallo-beta-lactamase class B
MNRRAITLAAAVAVTTGTALIAGQPPVVTQAPAPITVNGLLSAAKVAARTDWAGTFLRLCIPPPATGAGSATAAGTTGRGNAPASAAATSGAPGRGASAGSPAGPPRSAWYAEPAKVADNFYFIGTKVHNAWALAGSDGIIIFEALFDYAAPDEVVDGLRKLGLDKNKVKHILISHAHADHDGGARYLQDSMMAARLIYGAADWDLVDRSTGRAGGKPKRDTVGTDGMTVSVGDASVQIVTMPGHTAGTLSFLFEMKDGGRPIRAAYVGGTAIPFDATAEYYDGYIASARKMAKAAADFGATALLSNHTEFDDGYYKSHTAASRKQPGDPNPFDIGKDGVARYFTVVETCAMAAKLRATATR